MCECVKECVHVVCVLWIVVCLLCLVFQGMCFCM